MNTMLSEGPLQRVGAIKGATVTPSTVFLKESAAIAIRPRREVDLLETACVPGWEPRLRSTSFTGKFPRRRGGWR